MIPVAICGAAGRMGRMLTLAVLEHPELSLSGAIGSPRSVHLGIDCGTIAGSQPTGVAITDDIDAALDGTEVVIDFSTAESTTELVGECAKRGVGFVVGTTGFVDHQYATIRNASQDIPILLSPNMSVGVNVSFKLLEVAAAALGSDVDVEIFEIHHRHKVDAPSGTAVRMGEIVAAAQDSTIQKSAVYGREGITGERQRGTIGFHSARGGDVVGEHTVVFAGSGERIELTHRAGSRSNFAAGAMRASVFIADHLRTGQTGMYDMNEVLGL